MSGTFTIVKTNKQRQELIKHGTSLFPVNQYHDDFSIMNTVEWHWHPEFEAGVIQSGHLTAMINQEEFHLSEGDGFFINSEVLHADWDLDENSCQLDSIVFHPRLIGGSHDCILWQNYVNPVITNHAFYGLPLFHNNPDNRPMLEQIRSSIRLCDEQPNGFEFSVRNCLSDLLYHIYKLQSHYKTGLSETVIRNEERIKTMIAFIESNYQQNLSLQKIADSASVSKSESIRCFNKSIGRTPIQFLKEFRLQKAASLLASTDMSIGDVAFSCGFSEMSYFTRSFRTLYADTPTEYRRKMQFFRDF